MGGGGGEYNPDLTLCGQTASINIISEAKGRPIQAQKGGVSPGKIEEEWYLVFGAELPVH